MNKTACSVGLLGCAALLAACGSSVTPADQATTETTTASPTTGSPTTEATAGATTTVITPGTTASCQPVTESEIAGLFNRWNDDLKSGDPKKVVENYAADSILVPTVSNQVRRTAAEKEDYFAHFLANRPSGTIDFSDVELGCNMAVDSGLYTFAYAATGQKVQARYSFTYRWENGDWKIVSHHSSGMPEPAATTSGMTTTVSPTSAPATTATTTTR